MRLSFACQSNVGYPYLNYVEFEVDGKSVLVDRWETDYEYDEKTGYLSMEWLGLYIWDGEQELKIPDGYLDGAEFVGFDIEDDAPEGYEIIVFDYAVY